MIEHKMMKHHAKNMADPEHGRALNELSFREFINNGGDLELIEVKGRKAAQIIGDGLRGNNARVS